VITDIVSAQRGNDLRIKLKDVKYKRPKPTKLKMHCKRNTENYNLELDITFFPSYKKKKTSLLINRVLKSF
jgi:hypothetical protein